MPFSDPTGESHRSLTLAPMMSSSRSVPHRPLPRWTAIAVLLAVTLAPTTALSSPERAAAHYDNAQKAYQANDMDAASIHLKNALQQDGKMLAAHLLLGRVLTSLGQFKAAEAALEEALRQGVNRAEIAPLLGHVYLQLGEPRKVLDSFPATGLPPGQQSTVLTLRGSAHAMMSNLAQATESFAEARRADPNSARPYIAEAPMLLRAGEREKARAAALKGTELAPTDGFAWYQRGAVLQTLGDLAGALSAFDKAIALTPKHVDSHVSRAMALLSSGQKAEAEKTLQYLKEQKVQEPRASWLRGMLARERGDAKAAKEEFTQAVNLIDPMAPATRNVNEPLLMAGALSHYELGQREKVREYLDALLGRNSRHLAGQLLFATLLLEAQDYSRAQPLLEGLLRAMPDNSRVQYMLGTLHLARKQFAQAAEYLERASRKGSNDAALRELSFSQFGQGQNRQALTMLEGVVARNPKDVRAGIELAVVYARLGQEAKAVSTANALVKLEPENLTLLNFLGNVKGRLGDRKGQREAYQRVLDKDPKFRQVVLNMGWLDMDEGRMDAARTRLQGFVKDNSKDPDALLQLGLLEQRTRRFAEALAVWKQADEAQTKDPRAGIAIVELLLSLRQNDQAVAAGKSIAARYPESIPVLLVHARAQLQGGDRAIARQVLNEATKLAGFDAAALVQVARMQMAAGNADGAAHAVGKALQSAPDDADALMLAVEVAARRGTAADVDKAFGTLQAKLPNHLNTLTIAGHIALSRGQPGKAAIHYRAAFDRYPSTPASLLLCQALLANNDAAAALAQAARWSQRNPGDLMALRSLAELQAQAGKAEESKKSYAQLLTADPGDAMAVAAYARVLGRLKDPAAVDVAERAHKMAPQNLMLANGYGWMLVEAGKIDQGVRVLHESRLRDPNFPGTRWHLAAALLRAGRKAEARDELQAAVSAQQPPPPGLDASRLRADLGL